MQRQEHMIKSQEINSETEQNKLLDRLMDNWLEMLEHYFTDEMYVVKAIVISDKLRLIYFKKQPFEFSCMREVSYSRAKNLSIKRLYNQI